MRQIIYLLHLDDVLVLNVSSISTWVTYIGSTYCMKSRCTEEWVKRSP